MDAYKEVIASRKNKCIKDDSSAKSSPKGARGGGKCTPQTRRQRLSSPKGTYRGGSLKNLDDLGKSPKLKTKRGLSRSSGGSFKEPKMANKTQSVKLAPGDSYHGSLRDFKDVKEKGSDSKISIGELEESR